MTSSAPVLVILAAGASSRLGEPKALVDLGGKSPLDRLLAAGNRACGDRALVVAGADFEAIREAIREVAPETVEVLQHRGWSSGRTGSIQAACSARPDRDLLIAPVDVPLVPATVFENLISEWRSRSAPPRGWLAPAVRRKAELRTGHPVLLGRELGRELAELAPDASLRILRGRAAPLWRIEVQSERILDDLDTPLDLKNLRALSSD